jgi:hypothetical protein
MTKLGGINLKYSSELTFKTFICHNGTPFLRFQTKEFSMWNIRGSVKIRWEPDSILEIENLFRSVLAGESEVG